MKTDDLILLLAAAAALFIVMKAGKVGTAAAQPKAVPWAPDMLNGTAQAQGWVQDGNTMYSPDGTYYVWDPTYSTWHVVGQWDPATGRKLN